MFLGIDIGSSSSKVAVLDANRSLAAIKTVNRGTGTDGVDEALAAALREAGIGRDDILHTVVTGYGRMSYRHADKQITEITCHAKGVTYLTTGVHTIIDIGGQDAKVIRINSDGDVENFLMNEKCAAGTGRFLEVVARVLACDLDELSDLAERSTDPVSISSVCTVFAESELISRLAADAKREDAAKGAHISVSNRVAGMAGRIGIVGRVVMTGGVALNGDMVKTMARALEMSVTACPHPQAAGAIGAACYAMERYQKAAQREANAPTGD
jgi:predicted CoA-substrate-specific enzyme activase